jgi:sugar (pentulose or hexulose) kinase
LSRILTRMQHSLGIDVGTSGVRAAVLDAQGQPCAEASQPLVEQNPEAWWSNIEQVLVDLASRSDLEQIGALAIDATSSTVLLCDTQGHTHGPVLMYSDCRATDAARCIAKLAPAESGAHGASSSLAKLLWLREHGNMTANDRAVHQADWLAGQFLGRFDRSDENNALKLGYDPVNRCWPDWLDTLGIDRSQLPRVSPPGSCLGTVTTGMRRRFGLASDCRVAAGTTDSTAACLAAGAGAPGDAVTVLGSTLVVKILSRTPVFAPEYGVYSHRLGDQWLVGGASNAGGAVLRQFFSDSELTQLSKNIDPDTDSGLDYYPLPAAGERFPINNPTLAPRLSPRPANDADFLKGLLEGIAHIESAAYARLAELGAPAVQRIYSLGGGAQNPVWTRMRARLLGVPILMARYEQAAVGAALLARQCLQAAQQ